MCGYSFISLYHGCGLLQPPSNRDTELFHLREDATHASRLLHPPSCLTLSQIPDNHSSIFFLIYMGSHSMFLLDPAFSFITMSLRFQIHKRFVSLKSHPYFLLSSIPWYEWITVFLNIHLRRNIWLLLGLGYHKCNCYEQLFTGFFFFCRFKVLFFWNKSVGV